LLDGFTGDVGPVAETRLSNLDFVCLEINDDLCIPDCSNSVVRIVAPLPGLDFEDRVRLSDTREAVL